MEVHKIDYGQRVYQGTLDAVRQVIIATMLVIDAYNGEAIGEPWISDRDEYVAGTTPSTGAQVAYTLDEPLEIPVVVSNLPIKSLSGYTHIESSTGDMEVEYITEEFQPIVDLIESNKHIYSTAEQIVGTWIDGSVVYERVFELSSTITINSQGQNIKPLVTNPPSIETILSAQAVNDAGGTDAIYMDLVNDQYRCYCADQINNAKYVICQYTKSTPTRSLNLTKSAVNEIPDEIKNAPFEEKPDYNEADDDAPTEVDER